MGRASTVTVRKNGTISKVKDPPLWKVSARDLMKTNPKPGFLIKREWLVQQAGLIEPDVWTRKTWEEFSFALLAFTENFRKHLLEFYRVDIKKVPHKGYEIVNPKEQTANALIEGFNEIARVLNKTTMRVLYVDPAALNTKEKKENLEALVKLGMIKTAFSKHRRMSHRCYKLLDTKLSKAKIKLEVENDD